MFKHNTDGILKARIVPLGHRDPIKYGLCPDEPCMQPEYFRLLMSIAATKAWSTGEMDISGAYLQIDGLRRTVYIIPPKDGTENEAWLLTSTVYGLIEITRLCYRTSNESLRKYRLKNSAKEYTLYTLKNEGHLELVVLVQVENYICTGKSEAMSKLEEFLTRKVIVDDKLKGNYSVYGAQVSRTGDGIIQLSQENQVA